ncbi:MAG: hypothetical protein AAGA77_07850 [Bacteroidota bacterium]
MITDKLNTVEVIPNTPEERIMLQKVMEEIKDVPAFLDTIVAIIESSKKLNPDKGPFRVIFTEESERYLELAKLKKQNSQ